MYNLIKTKYLVLISVLLLGSYAITQFYSKELGIIWGVSKKVASETSFIILILILFVIGVYFDKLRYEKVKNSDYIVKNYRNTKRRIIYICLAIFTLLVYIFLSINSSYPPFFLWTIIFILLTNVFWGKAYINSEIIVLGNKVISIRQISKVEVVSNSFGNKLLITFNDDIKTVDFISYELREYVINTIENINN